MPARGYIQSTVGVRQTNANGGFGAVVVDEGTWYLPVNSTAFALSVVAAKSDIVGGPNVHEYVVSAPF